MSKSILAFVLGTFTGAAVVWAALNASLAGERATLEITRPDGSQKVLSLRARNFRLPVFGRMKLQAPEAPVQVASIRLAQRKGEVAMYNEYRVFYSGAMTYIELMTPETGEQAQEGEVPYSYVTVVPKRSSPLDMGWRTGEERLAAAIEHLAALSTVPVLQDTSR